MNNLEEHVLVKIRLMRLATPKVVQVSLNFKKEIVYAKIFEQI